MVLEAGQVGSILAKVMCNLNPVQTLATFEGQFYFK